MHNPSDTSNTRFLCVGVNPSFDITLTLDGLDTDRVNRVRSESRLAAGKAVNVARALHSAQRDCRLMLVLGEDNAKEFLSQISNIETEIHIIPGATRENLTLLSGGDTIKINRDGAQVRAEDIDALEVAVRAHADAADIVVFSGSLPPGMESDGFLRLVRAASLSDVRVALDTAALSREQVSCVRPWLYKPNEHELADLCSLSSTDEAVLISAAQELAREGVGIVLLTMGARGLAAVTAEEVVRVRLPEVRAVNTVGAGDTALAGFLARYADGGSLASCAEQAALWGRDKVMQR
ncbi:MAG: hexose kinase [Clostridia bacterium]|nr:hexose kinase [Clostridia bacterium]